MNEPASLKIRVGASLNTDVARVFKPLVATTKDASREILAIWRALSRDMSSVFADGMMKTRVGVRTDAADIGKTLATTAKGLDAIRGKFAQVAVAARQGLDISGYARAAENDFSRVERAALRTQRSMGGGGSGSYARNVGFSSVKYFDSSIRTGMGIARSIARGAGIDMNLGAQVMSIAQQQKTAADIAAEGFMPSGDVVANRRRVGRDEIRGSSNAVADHAGFDRSDTLGALQSFVGKTGDLQAGRDSLKSMATIARATGSDMKDLVTASADLSNVLGEIPDKGTEVARVMMAIAGQAKTGAVSIRDLPSSMAKIVSQARNFVVDPAMRAIFAAQGITTNVGMSVASVGVLAQAARQRGGATSAGVATNDAMAFIRDASTHAEMKRWSDAGLNVFADKGHTMIRDPKALILEALRYSNGDLGKLSNLFPNKSSRAVAMAFTGSYKEAGGGAAGLAAAGHQYDLLARSSMGDKELNDSFAQAMKETVPKVQQFQNRLQDTAEVVSGKILPVFEKLEPTILALTEKFGGMVAWAADNPGKAITTAIVGSIARAGVENAFRAAIEGALSGKGGGGKAGAGIGGGAGVSGNLLAGLSIATLAIGTATIGMAVIDDMADDSVKRQRRKIAGEAAEFNASHGMITDSRTGEQRQMTDAEFNAYRNRKASEVYGALDRDLAKQARDTVRLSHADPTSELASTLRQVLGVDAESIKADHAKIDETNRLLAGILAYMERDKPHPVTAPVPGGGWKAHDPHKEEGSQ